MKDFLFRLIERNQGRLPLTEPLKRSPFAGHPDSVDAAFGDYSVPGEFEEYNENDSAAPPAATAYEPDAGLERGGRGKPGESPARNSDFARDEHEPVANTTGTNQSNESGDAPARPGFFASASPGAPPSVVRPALYPSDTVDVNIAAGDGDDGHQPAFMEANTDARENEYPGAFHSDSTVEPAGESSGGPSVVQRFANQSSVSITPAPSTGPAGSAFQANTAAGSPVAGDLSPTVVPSGANPGAESFEPTFPSSSGAASGGSTRGTEEGAATPIGSGSGQSSRPVVAGESQPIEPTPPARADTGAAFTSAASRRAVPIARESRTDATIKTPVESVRGVKQKAAARDATNYPREHVRAVVETPPGGELRPGAVAQAGPRPPAATAKPSGVVPVQKPAAKVTQEPKFPPATLVGRDESRTNVPSHDPGYFEARSSETSRPAAPGVKINIGRIEIRATRPEAPASPPAEPPASRTSAMSLDEYLRRRSGGDL